MTTLGYLRSVREWAYPTLKSSAFLERGVLTPEEFVRAGDELVYKCPTWTWESGDPSRAKSYLPRDKQYLVTRNVPCQNRVATMEQTLDFSRAEGDGNNDGDGEGNDDDDDWLVSHKTNPSIHKEEGGVEDDFDILDESGEVVAPTMNQDEDMNEAGAAAKGGDGGGDHEGEDEDEYADMADYEDDDVLQDDDAAAPPQKSKNADNDDDDSSSNLIKVRTYDLSITYDKYYQTPRVWMVGKSAEGQPLSGKEMMQDVISDYANKTVTIENHPHVAGPHASIHPCQHGKVMCTIVQNLIKASAEKQQQAAAASVGAAVAATAESQVVGTTDEGPCVEMYIFIFLKFVSSIIPTINYDFTMDVTASTSK
jgi:ubiquitin-like-conjugating enzyme ATG3